MRDFGSKRSSTSGRDENAAAAGPGAGKRTLTDMLPPAKSPVQRMAAVSAPAPVSAVPNAQRQTLHDLFGGVQRKLSVAEPDPATIHADAQQGIATAAAPLPYAETIQRAFGRYDVSTIQAHTNADAASSARSMSAKAYTVGDHVVLGEGADLHTVAHEAAHVVQQRGGLQIPNGVGSEGDPHEQHANEVASRVTRGASAEPLLDRYASPQGATGSSSPVQRVQLGAEGELDTRNARHHAAIAAHLDLLPLDALGFVRDALDPENPLDRKVLHEVEIRVARTQGLETIAGLGGGEEVWTMGSIFINEKLINETSPMIAGGDVGHYSDIPHARLSKEEFEISQRDSEVATIENILGYLDEHDKAATASARQRSEPGDQKHLADLDSLEAERNLVDDDRDQINQIKRINAQLSHVHTLRIVLSGTAGPCDGCKARLEALVSELGLRYPDASIRLEVNYLGFVDVVERAGRETSYGYADQRVMTSATNRKYFSKELGS